MQRVSVVGSSGSGKTTVGQALADILDAPFTELDSVQHQENWTPTPPDEFMSRVETLAAGDRWVIDGNYEAVVPHGPVWRRADTVVWLDVSKTVAMWQVTRRTLTRAVTRKELWNGNREEWSNILSWDPERSMMRWVWTTHGPVRERYEALSSSVEFDQVTFVRLRDRAEIDEWLADVSRRFVPTSTD